VIIFWYILLSHVLTCITLAPLFEKAGVARWKAYVPGLNFVEWCKIIGKPTWEAVYLLFPVVNFFTYAGMKVDLVRSFGKYQFWHTALAVLFSPAIFWMLRNDAYTGPTLEKELAYANAIAEADQKGMKAKVEQLVRDNPYQKGQLREWGEAIFFAVFAASFIRMFLIEAYVIPTSSMEGSLLVGDFLFVSKAHYGIRMPMTLFQLPLLHNRIPILDRESYLTTPQMSYTRLPALEPVQRNTPIVFNYPDGDSVIIQPNRTYNINDIKRMGAEPSNMPLTVRPIDKKDHYIKRCVAIAGDTLEIRNRQIHINGQASPNPSGLQFRYRISGGVSAEKLSELGVNLEDGANSIYHLTPKQAETINGFGGNVKVEFETATLSGSRGGVLYPHDTAHFNTWTLDNFGPIYVPKQGATTTLTPENVAMYRTVIEKYEHNKLDVKEGKSFINGKESANYTFKQNYYWMMGDNRHNSEDSRYWGFVPEDHVVGKPLFIWFSTKNANIANGIRWERIFSGATKM
jgi:signal peptidase I